MMVLDGIVVLMAALAAWEFSSGQRIGTRPRLATSAGRHGTSDETVQFAQIERLVQIAECPLDERVGLLPALVVSAHHEDWRIYAKIADALEQVETLSPAHGVPDSRHDHVQQNEVE